MLSISKPVSEKEEAAAEEGGRSGEEREEGCPFCPGAIMGMHFLAITAGGFGWVRVGSEQEKEKGKNRGRRSRGRILLIGCACLAHLLCAVCAPARG